MNLAETLVERHGPQTVIDALGPLLSDNRKERIEEILEIRLVAPTVVLENMYDSRNGAAVIRSAEAFGLSAIHVVAPQREFKASATVTIGAEKWLDVYRHENIKVCADSLRSKDFSLCALVPGATQTLADLSGDKKWAILLGNEQLGLTEAAVAEADETVSLPMWGFSQSYNLSVSAALALQVMAPERRKAMTVSGDLTDNKRAQLRARWYAQGMRGVENILKRYIDERNSKPTQKTCQK